MFERSCVLLGVPVLVLVGCAANENEEVSGKVDQPLVLTAATRVAEEGLLEFDTTVFADNPTTLLEAGDFHGYEFHGKAGGVVTISMTAPNCGAPDTFVYLFGPEDASGDRGVDLIHNDDVGVQAFCELDSKINGFTLPVDGTYLIVASSFEEAGGGHYQLAVSCGNGACRLPGEKVFADSRISQADIDGGKFTPAELFDNGDFLFETIYRVEDGMGNALNGAPAGTNPRPNFRSVHFAAFGAPEAQSCLTCHNVGGDDGAGDLNHNIFQIGDGVNPASGVPRNPPIVLGLGLRQQIGIEMTNELKAELAAAKAAATTQNAPVTAALTAKGVSFGSIIANPDGTVDATGVRGVDADPAVAATFLVVKPFGWKGREATLRRFVEGGFRVHFGMQTAPSIAKHCATPNPNTFGNGPDCQDPDGDGVKDEITEGQLSSMAIYMGLRETPVRVPPRSSTDQARAAAGEQLFTSIGCATCHTATMRLEQPVHVEPADTTGGAGITLHLATDTKDPHPALNQDGSMTVELWSDFKRHDMGAALADGKPFNQIAANQFITTPLWGVATTAPYLHDGRAPTLNDAILAHAGEGQAVRDAYSALSADDQGAVLAFLGTLSRAENLAPPEPETVDLSGFVLRQASSSLNFTLPAGTVVPHGGYVVVARNATQDQCERFYGRALTSNVVFINSASAFPKINGSERYTLRDGVGTVVDGPTVAQPSDARKNFQRISGSLPPGTGSSWRKRTATPAIATPGSGQQSTGGGQIYISEFSDATGAGNSVFEFVEVFVE